MLLCIVPGVWKLDFRFSTVNGAKEASSCEQPMAEWESKHQLVTSFPYPLLESLLFALSPPGFSLFRIWLWPSKEPH